MQNPGKKLFAKVKEPNKLFAQTKNILENRIFVGCFCFFYLGNRVGWDSEARGCWGKD